MKILRIQLISVLIAALGVPLVAAADDTRDRVEKLLKKMSLTEKLGQLNLEEFGFYNPENIEELEQAIREGKIGGFLNIPRSPHYPNAFDRLQKIAIEQSPNGIPLIYGHDVIHGYKTIFPIPLGMAASWDTEAARRAARVAAIEATSAGVRWTFAPMVDISRDPRWGRIAESFGEDVYLSSLFSAATVRGFHGKGLGSANSIGTCAKHYAGYGAGEGGRDYNSAIISSDEMRNTYLPPFKAAIDAGGLCLMSGYHTVNGIPTSAHPELLTDILRKEWGFTGFVVSDWNSIAELIPHGYARDERHAAKLALEAGVDFEMHSDTYQLYLRDHLDNKSVGIDQIDQAVRRMLYSKIKMGLFDSPYTDTRRLDETLSEPFLRDAQRIAEQSMVLLKNEGDILPLKKKQKVAIIGPMAEVPYQQLGTWIYEGEKADSRTLLPALQEYLGSDDGYQYARGLAYSRSRGKDMFGQALEAAEDADIIVFFGGEEAILSGEGHSRGRIDLPGAQVELLRELARLDKPLALVILAGRPISLEGVLEHTDAVLMAWHPGTMAGPALVRTLYGEHNPSGRLPLSWPKSSGQIPIYYNHRSTGRPPQDDNYTRIDKIDPGVEWQHDPGNSSNYLDYGHQPEFPFGYGLGYTRFQYKKFAIEEESLSLDGELEVSIVVKNIGDREGVETVQLYIRDLVGSYVRPVKQLMDFTRIHLKSGKSKRVRFKLPVERLGFYGVDNEYRVEPGEFKVWIGASAADERFSSSFNVKPE